MTAELAAQGFIVNRKRVSRLMELMGIEAIYPIPRRRPTGIRSPDPPPICRGASPAPIYRARA